ncbi:uncharacterized protein LOC115212363 isoform X1 [Octopus sinensis]|uniref:Uncharacterized protein LOC115212363 isoform X1 n=1 Tax=Octopus sinensis TaxID=2607531 RepID=A0A6P7SGK5_9MOLL|nr:uncharacterized protein LOC115212363 isoform X1 [Octopus sinensis]
MSPHGIKGTGKKNKCSSLSVNGPKMLAKKKRKILSETPDVDVSGKATSWRGLKIESSNDLKEKILKQLTCPSRQYKGRDGEIELPPKKKRKFQNNGSVETDSDVEKTSRRSKLMKKQYLEKPSSKMQRWKKLAEDAEFYGSSNSASKGKKKKKLMTVNYDDGVCVYDLHTPSKLKKMKRQKGANHIVNKKKVHIGKRVITPHKGGRKEAMKPKLNVSSSRLKLLSKKQRKKLEENYSLQIYSDVELSDSDVSADGQNVISIKKGKFSMPDKWSYRQLLSKKKAKSKKEQECNVGKIKKSKQHHEHVLEDEDSYDNIEEASSDEDLSEVDDDDEDEDEVDDAEEDDDDEEEEDDDDDEDDDDEDSEAQMSDERLGAEKKNVSNQNLPNGNWEMINDERCREVTQEDYGSAWKQHDGDTTSIVLHPWPHGNNFQEQQPHSHQVLQKNKHAGLANTSNLSIIGGVLDSTLSGHNNPGISHPSLQHYHSEQEKQQSQFTENHIQVQDGSVRHFGDQTQIYNTYNVDVKSQTHISNNQTDPNQSSQPCHLQQYTDLNHTQSQPNGSSFGASKVKYYYPASFGKEGILEVERALQPVPPEEVLTQGFRINIKRCDMATLVGANWLNDEIINFYMNIIVQRSKIDGYPSVYIPSTFFFPMVMKRGYNGVRRWTKNVDIFDHDLMLIPIHLESENHWTLIAVDFLQSSICYYDSYLQDRDDAMDAILNYLREEMKTKKNIEMDTNCWVKVNMKNIPLQENMSDCGVFSCIYAEYISRGDKMDFTQEDMPYFRRKMVYEILNHKIVNHSPRDLENMISDDLLDDITSANENGHILTPDIATAVIQNGLPDNFQGPTKVSEEAMGLAAVSKDTEGVRDVEKTQNGSTGGEMEEKASPAEAGEETSRKHKTNLISEIKRIVSLFDDVSEEKRNLLESQLFQLLRENLQNSNQKAKKFKIRHNDLASIMSVIEKHSGENSESDELNSVSDDSASSSTVSSSSRTTTSSTVSSDKGIKSSDDTEVSSLSDNSEESGLFNIMKEMEKMFLSLAAFVRIICKTDQELLKGKAGEASSRSNSVIKGISYITSKLENINQRLKSQSILKTAAQQHMTSQHDRKTSKKCMSQRLVIQKKSRRNERDIMKTKHCLRNSVTFSNQVGSEEDISNDETTEARLFTSAAKNLGISLESGAYLKKLHLRKNLLKKFPLPADVFDLNCQLQDKAHKQHAFKSMVRSDHCKKGKKKK